MIIWAVLAAITHHYQKLLVRLELGSIPFFCLD